MGSPLNIGIVGVGNISNQYFDAIVKLPGLRLVAIADLNMDRAREVAQERGTEALTVDELIADPRIDAVLNLTIPAAHVEVGIRALEAGKHVYAEKPLALDVADGRRLIEAGEKAGLRVGSAPDTFLGTGIQTSRRLLDDGEIGEVIGASAFWTAPGHELWHPAPGYFYAPGGGPLLDMGPYYITALVALLGPVVRVSGSVARSSRKRTIATGPSAGEPVEVLVDTHVSAILEHASGVSSTVTVSYEVWASRRTNIEVYGTAGTIAVPDPNAFSDVAQIFRAGATDWEDAPATDGYADAGRAFGLADMAHAIETGREHRASGALGLHALEIMESILVAGREKRVVELTTTVERPEPVAEGSTPDSW